MYAVEVIHRYLSHREDLLPYEACVDVFFWEQLDQYSGVEWDPGSGFSFGRIRQRLSWRGWIWTPGVVGWGWVTSRWGGDADSFVSSSSSPRRAGVTS